ncbi:FAD/NAD(P)-binding protein [Legionella pneumophila serogroup 10]
MKTLPSKVIFIGAGPSGLFAARRLKEIAKLQNKTVECIFLEREPVVGGKCHTYSDADYPELKTEWGAALVAPNYGVVLMHYLSMALNSKKSCQRPLKR